MNLTGINVTINNDSTIEEIEKPFDMMSVEERIRAYREGVVQILNTKVKSNS